MLWSVLETTFQRIITRKSDIHWAHGGHGLAWAIRCRNAAVVWCHLAILLLAYNRSKCIERPKRSKKLYAGPFWWLLTFTKKGEPQKKYWSSHKINIGKITWKLRNFHSTSLEDGIPNPLLICIIYHICNYYRIRMYLWNWIYYNDNVENCIICC